jgi:choline dehydrogenase
LNARALNYARGKVLGGCSSINAMIYMRGQKSDYDHWAALGNNGWSWEEILPYYKRVEDYAHGADELHGAGGGLRIEERRVSWEILDSWRDAAEQCGIPKIAEFNRGNNFGNAYFQMNQRRGVRWSATKAFLRPAMKRANLTVLTGAHVNRVCIETTGSAKRASGIEFRLPGENEQRAQANREVILAAGAIGSPQILQLSGIGPGALLSRFGIPLVRANSLLGRIAMGLEYALFRTGPLTMPPSQLGAFAKSDSSQPSANIEWHVQPLSLDKFGDPLHRFAAITPSVCNLRPTSRGHVQIVSPDPAAQPSIRLNYLSTPEDQQVAVDSMRFTRRIMAASALAKYAPEEWKPGVQVRSDDELLQAAGDLGTTIFHPVGTCKMGQDELAVVDERLRVRGIAALRVIDASVMPRITSGNTNAPTTMIAEKGAEFVLQDRA